MRIIPIALIVIGVLGVLKHYGFIDPAILHLIWPLLLIGIGVAMLLRGPRWGSHMREHMQDRWEQRMHHRFGPGWANLSEEERDRFRAGMRQRKSRCHSGSPANSFAPSDASDPPSSKPAPPPPASNDQH